LAGLTLSLMRPKWPWQASAMLPLIGILIEIIRFRAAVVEAWTVLSAVFFWCLERHLERKLEIAEMERKVAERQVDDNVAHLMSVFKLEHLRAEQAAIRSDRFNVPSASTEMGRSHDRTN
jgi:hypothetical protein